MFNEYGEEELCGLINQSRDDIKVLWQAFEENEADDLMKEIVADEHRAAILITQLVSCIHNLYEAGNDQGKELIMALLHPIES